MKKKFAALTILSTFAALAAHADCPKIEGRYSYKCTVTRDSEADLGSLLETSGQMIVDQIACDMYRLTETVKGVENVIDLNHRDSSHHEDKTKIKKSNSRTLRYRSVRESEELFAVFIGEVFVTKAKIRTTRKGFVLKGKEKSKTFGIFGDKHSEFSCKFERI